MKAYTDTVWRAWNTPVRVYQINPIKTRPNEVVLSSQVLFLATYFQQRKQQLCGTLCSLDTDLANKIYCN